MSGLNMYLLGADYVMSKFLESRHSSIIKPVEDKVIAQLESITNLSDLKDIVEQFKISRGDTFGIYNELMERLVFSISSVVDFNNHQLGSKEEAITDSKPAVISIDDIYSASLEKVVSFAEKVVEVFFYKGLTINPVSINRNYEDIVISLCSLMVKEADSFNEISGITILDKMANNWYWSRTDEGLAEALSKKELTNFKCPLLYYLTQYP